MCISLLLFPLRPPRSRSTPTAPFKPDSLVAVFMTNRRERFHHRVFIVSFLFLRLVRVPGVGRPLLRLSLLRPRLALSPLLCARTRTSLCGSYPLYVSPCARTCVRVYYIHTYTISKRNKFPFYTVTYRLFKRKLKAENGIIIVVGHEGNLSVFSAQKSFHPPTTTTSRSPPTPSPPSSSTLLVRPAARSPAFHDFSLSSDDCV